MTVESVTYISDLEPDRPRSSDRISQGDDHIRNIKLGLKQTFPNINGEVRATDEEVNYLVGLTGPIKDEINAGANDISQLQADVATNKANIATNAANISANAANISTNAAGISTNAAGISTNAANIAKNKSDIAAIIPYVDAQNAAQDAVIAGKADKSNSYTKAEIDALIAAASKGGPMVKIKQQPSSAGSFSLSFYDNKGGQGYSRVMGSETSTLTLSVPNGMVFCLQGITAHVESGVIRLQAGNIFIDGVDVNGGLTTNMEWGAGEDHVWPNNQNCAPIMVESSVQLYNVYCSGQGFAPQILLQGYFVEA